VKLHSLLPRFNVRYRSPGHIETLRKFTLRDLQLFSFAGYQTPTLAVEPVPLFIHRVSLQSNPISVKQSIQCILYLTHLFWLTHITKLAYIWFESEHSLQSCTGPQQLAFGVPVYQVAKLETTTGPGEPRCRNITMKYRKKSKNYKMK
jgi:hypothetical protein